MTNGEINVANLTLWYALGGTMTDEIKSASMTEVYRYLAGDNLNGVPATLSTEQKKSYPLAQFRQEWGTLSDQDKEELKSLVGELA